VESSILKITEYPGMGRGVQATAHIKADTVIEISHLIIMPSDNIRNKDVLAKYVFNINGREVAVVLGIGSLFNDKKIDNNVRYVVNESDRVIHFITIRDIEAGEQLFISYDSPTESIDKVTNNRVNLP